MGFLIGNGYWAETAILVLTVLYLLHWYFRSLLDFWSERGVPEVKTKELVFGSVKKLVFLKKQFSLHFQDLYNELEGHKYGGYFDLSKPGLMIRDPELIKHVMVKDFASFTDNPTVVNAKNDPMFAFNIFAMKGEQWKYARSKLAPAFATGKIKTMFPLILEICEELKQNLQRKIESEDGAFEAHSLCADYTTDVVGSCAFAIRSDSLKNPDNQFRSMGRNLLTPDNLWRKIEMMIAFDFPRIASLFRLKLVSQQVEDFFRDLMTKAFSFREKHPEFKRNDFISLMMQLKKLGGVEVDEHDRRETGGVDDKEITDKAKIEFNDTVLAAQAVGFFIDGFETSSKILSFAVHELAMNPDIQVKLREELQKSFEANDGKMDYDNIRNCPYFDQFLDEVLRVYALGGALFRECTKRYTLPDTNVQLEVGQRIAIPVYGIHHDPQYYSNPEVFDPLRFTEEAKKSRHPFTFLAFGEGPRKCVGFRFAQAQTKAALATIVLNFELQKSEKTTHPVVFDDTSLLLHARDGLHLKVAPL